MHVFLIFPDMVLCVVLTVVCCAQSSCGTGAAALPCTCEDVAYLEALSPSLWASLVRQRSDIVAAYAKPEVEGTSLEYKSKR
jgi:hypothetical protein